MKKSNLISLIFYIAIFLFTLAKSGGAQESTPLVPCDDNCNLCHLLVGISNIFNYLMYVLLGLLFMTAVALAGIAYMLSGISDKVLNFAKRLLAYSLSGLIICLISWVIINTFLNVLGFKAPQGGNWYEHDCLNQKGSNLISLNQNKVSSGGEGKSLEEAQEKVSCKEGTKQLQSVKISCCKGNEQFISISTFPDPNGNVKDYYNLKAIGKYKCLDEFSNFKEVEEDVTKNAYWIASDETLIKVSGGVVKALKDSWDLPPYVEARLGNKISNQVRVYVNACPKMLESSQRSNDSIDSSSSVIKLDLKEFLSFNFKARAEEVTSQACSNDCPENIRKTCHLVYGSRDARFVFVLMRANIENLGQHTNPCAKSEAWDEKSLSELNYFRNVARNFAKGLDLSKFPDKFGVWISDKVGVDDADCPVGDFTSYGYVIKGPKNSNNKAYAIVSSKKAVYCSGEGELEEAPQIFAHEQIGHIFAKLDDEYETCNGNSQGFESMPHYNCTDPKNVSNEGMFKYKTKWGKLSAVPKGCGYSNTLMRATLNSVMRNHRMRAFILFGSLPNFGPVNNRVIEETIENYPNGYDQWAEKITYRCGNND